MHYSTIYVNIENGQYLNLTKAVVDNCTIEVQICPQNLTDFRSKIKCLNDFSRKNEAACTVLKQKIALRYTGVLIRNIPLDVQGYIISRLYDCEKFDVPIDTFTRHTEFYPFAKFTSYHLLEKKVDSIPEMKTLHNTSPAQNSVHWMIVAILVPVLVILVACYSWYRKCAAKDFEVNVTKDVDERCFEEDPESSFDFEHCNYDSMLEPELPPQPTRALADLYDIHDIKPEPKAKLVNGRNEMMQKYMREE